MGFLQEFVITTDRGMRFPLLVEKNETSFTYRYYLQLQDDFVEYAMPSIGSVIDTVEEVFSEMISDVMRVLKIGNDAILQVDNPYGTEFLSANAQHFLLKEMSLQHVSVTEFSMLYNVGDFVAWFGDKALVVGTRIKPLNHPANRFIMPCVVTFPYLPDNSVKYFDDFNMDYQIMFCQDDGEFIGYKECLEKHLEKC